MKERDMSPSLSRRHSMLGACACLGVVGCVRMASAALPPGYTPPTYLPEPGKAPAMQTRLISGQGEPRAWAIIFRDGDEIMSGLLDWAQREKVSGGYLSGIGAFSSALFGWFDKSQKAFRNIPVKDQIEVVGLTGDIGLVGDKPALHIHGSVAHSDGTIRGGHLIMGVASPTVELFVTESGFPLHKREDPATTLQIFDLSV